MGFFQGLVGDSLEYNVKKIQVTKNCKGYIIWSASYSILYLTKFCYNVSEMIERRAMTLLLQYLL